LETYALPENLFCVSYALIREQLIQTIEKYIIMDDVTLSDETQRLGTFSLEGPAAAAIVSELTGVDLKSFAELQRRDTLVGAIRAQSFVVHQEKLWELKFWRNDSTWKCYGVYFRKR